MIVIFRLFFFHSFIFVNQAKIVLNYETFNLMALKVQAKLSEDTHLVFGNSFW